MLKDFFVDVLIRHIAMAACLGKSCLSLQGKRYVKRALKGAERSDITR